MVFEFEIVTSGSDAVVSQTTNRSGTAPTNPFNATKTSTSWSISDFRVIADIVTLDSVLQNSYAEYVLGCKALNISYDTWITMLQQTATSAGNNNMAVNISRAVSKLKTLFFSFDNAAPNLAVSISNKML